MQSLAEIIEDGNLDEIKLKLNKVKTLTIISYLHLIVCQTPDPVILNLLLDYLPPHYHEDYIYTVQYISFICQATSDNLKIILDHPTFIPPPSINLYIKATSVDTFSQLLSSKKITIDQDTLEYLLRHNDPDKIKLYLVREQIFIPTATELDSLCKKYTHYYSLSLILADPRVDVSHLDHKIIKKWVDQNIREIVDVLQVRLPDLINTLLEKKKKREEMHNSRPTIF